MSTGVVLVVDDETPIRSSLRRLLLFDEHEVLAADSGAAALTIMTERSIDVVVSDQHMPGMEGVELLREIRRRDPLCSRILFSGHVDIELLRNAVNTGEVYRFIAKPWDDDELRLAVRHALERTQLLRREQAHQRDLEQNNVNLGTDVAYREQALDLNQELLDRLPVAIIGIDPQGLITLTNLLAENIFPTAIPGMDVDEALPNHLIDWLHTRTGPCLDTDGWHYEIVDLGPRGMALSAAPQNKPVASPETRRFAKDS